MQQKRYETSLEDISHHIINGTFDDTRANGRPLFTPEMRAAAERIRAALAPLIQAHKAALAEEAEIAAQLDDAAQKVRDTQTALRAPLRDLIKAETDKHPLSLRLEAIERLYRETDKRIFNDRPVDLVAFFSQLDELCS